MPPARYKTLAYLCEYLHEISLLAESSQMNARNLSICIGPNLFVSPEAGSPNALSESLQANKELEVMIRRFEDVFPQIAADGFGDADFCTQDDIDALVNKK
jgi:hypothetical protein